MSTEAEQRQQEIAALYEDFKADWEIGWKHDPLLGYTWQARRRAPELRAQSPRELRRKIEAEAAEPAGRGMATVITLADRAALSRVQAVYGARWDISFQRDGSVRAQRTTGGDPVYATTPGEMRELLNEIILGPLRKQMGQL